MPSRSDQLLSAALTYRDAALRDTPVATRFEHATGAIAIMFDVLLHEAREAMASRLDAPPAQPYLHAVDLDTDEPGIVSTRDADMRIDRPAPPIPRVTHKVCGRKGGVAAASSSPPATPVVNRTPEEARAQAEADAAKLLSKAQTACGAAERRVEKARETKLAREAETPDERAARLAEAKAKREQRKRDKAEAGGDDPPARERKTKPMPAPMSEEAALFADASVAPSQVAVLPAAKRARKDAPQFFESPVVHHRHLTALESADPHAALLPALLHGESVDALEVIQGPPGTGKTRALVGRVPATGRVLLCAPTNVAAANLYARCVASGLGDECALAIAPERVPPGTAVLSNDPARRVVCATISGRASPALDAHAFEAVLVDEAAMVPESLVWTLLRREVDFLVLAGDVRQLPAQCSESGRRLAHERSLMQRLVEDLDYDNVVTLVTQNRMAPALLSFPNAAFYDGALRTGPHAPTEGSVVWHVLDDGAEHEDGTSIANRAEAVEAARLAKQEAEAEDDRTVVLLAPYAAQCKLLLAQKSGVEVHTIDSFQGREADVVVLTLVRDGSRGFGFWDDPRRVTVALTRARTKLVVVASRAQTWPADALLRRFYDHTRS